MGTHPGDGVGAGAPSGMVPAKHEGAMLFDGYSYGDDTISSQRSAVFAQDRGFDGWFTGQTSHDPFLLAARAAEGTTDLTIGTGVAVALSRSPMDVAYSAHDLQQLSGGRFVLGLGTQVRAHIERRFGMSWSSPVERMGEFIVALRAIWASWNEGSTLTFQGDFYQHTLMPPVFAPAPVQSGPPPIFLAAVGPKLTELAGAQADGLQCHGFTTERYLREQTLPALTRGLAAAGRDRRHIEVALPLFSITGESEEMLEAEEQQVRRQLSFYASTPAYRGVMEQHGWGDLHEQLHTLSRQGAWKTMPQLIEPEVLDTFALRGEPVELARRLRKRYAGLADRISFYRQPRFSDDGWRDFLNELRRSPSSEPSGRRTSVTIQRHRRE
jgi:probable F420-dependent oxidoreductase